MVRKIRYATEEDIFIAEASGIFRLNFGGNLHMRIDKKGHKYFQFRMSLNGRDTTLSIGKYPDMSLAQAREIAEKRQAEVVKARQENADATFRARLTRPTREKRTRKYLSFNNAETVGKYSHIDRKRKNIDLGFGYASFRNMFDAGQFLRNLSVSTKLLSPEIYSFIALQMFVPSQPEELLRAKWKDFNREQALWTIKHGRTSPNNGRRINPQIAFLSRKAVLALDDLHKVTGSGEYLFPTVASMTKSDRNKLIAQAIGILWPHYPIELDGFRHFFSIFAKENSYFVPELIDGMMAHSVGDESANNHRTYILQIRALADWWGSALTWVGFEID